MRLQHRQWPENGGKILGSCFRLSCKVRERAQHIVRRTAWSDSALAENCRSPKTISADAEQSGFLRPTVLRRAICLLPCIDLRSGFVGHLASDLDKALDALL
jgi:hypothetical protein